MDGTIEVGTLTCRMSSMECVKEGWWNDMSGEQLNGGAMTKQVEMMPCGSIELQQNMMEGEPVRLSVE